MPRCLRQAALARPAGPAPTIRAGSSAVVASAPVDMDRDHAPEATVEFSSRLRSTPAHPWIKVARYADCRGASRSGGCSYLVDAARLELAASALRTTPARAEGASTEHYALCRYGGSKNKPFCDVRDRTTSSAMTRTDVWSDLSKVTATREDKRRSAPHSPCLILLSDGQRPCCVPCRRRQQHRGCEASCSEPEPLETAAFSLAQRIQPGRVQRRHELPAERVP